MSIAPIMGFRIYLTYLEFINHPDEVVIGLYIAILILIFSAFFFFGKKRAAEHKLLELNRGLEKLVIERTEKMKANERRFHAMTDHASDIISMMDQDLNTIYINDAIENITGYTPEEMKNMKGIELVHPDDLEFSKTLYSQLMANPGIPLRRTLRLLHKNGNVVWLEGIVTNLLHDETIKAVISNYRDITARKISEELVIASEQKYRHTLDKMMEGIQIIDFEYRYIYVNEAVTKQGRYSAGELLGKTMMEKYPGIELSEMFAGLTKCMTERKPQFMINEFSYPDQSKAWFELNMQPVPEGVFILSIDISDRKNAEEALKQLNDELEQKVAERTAQLQLVNKELESFSYSVSHDLRAPLRAVSGYAKMIEEDYTAIIDSEGKRLLHNIQHNAQKMGTLIDDLLSFSRLGRKDVQRSRINVKELLEGVMIELNKNVKHSASVNMHHLIDLNADYALLNQVFYNLISNAIKYSSKEEQSRVDISSEKKENEIIYSISDNGAGFDMQYGHKLFGVFQRLHSDSEFEGTGVGLAIVQRIIVKHNGKVWAEGKPGEGATFYFSIPTA